MDSKTAEKRFHFLIKYIQMVSKNKQTNKNQHLRYTDSQEKNLRGNHQERVVN